ncbi:hypothetical protein C900_04042 [Fulvivirga imtechensis AK7]|uniref:Uncharacterized protein n=1 Tax=Fulvivirga imtechensis AK7 TaxID=1237149 RepID=L8JSM1_9BACT|nr:hypothetical protein C900_04042 [Fulvivirga imtechensis AK7]
MMLVIAQFVTDIKQQKQSTTDAHGKTRYIQEREGFFSPDVPESNYEVIA